MTFSRFALRLGVIAAALFVLAGCSGARGTQMIYQYGSPWTEASVNGVEGYFLIDTGASTTVLDTDMAERSGIQMDGSRRVTATTGEVTIGSGRANTITLAGFTHTDRAVSIQSLQYFDAPGGRRQAGLIGSDFLLDYTVAFDMEKARLYLAEAEAPLSGDMKPFNMELDTGTPTVEVFFGNDRLPAWGTFDTGSGYARERFVYVEVSQQRAEQLLGPRINSEPIEKATVVSLAGRQELPIHEYGPVRILGKSFPKVRLVVHSHGEGAFAERDAVLVSGSILNQFDRIEIDYPRRILWAR